MFFVLGLIGSIFIFLALVHSVGLLHRVSVGSLLMLVVIYFTISKLLGVI